MGTKKVELISMAEFGKMCGGISGEAISKAANKGDVYRDLKTKLINPNHPKNKAYQDRPSRQRSKATGVEEEEVVRDLGGSSLKGLSESELKRLRLIGQIEEKELKNDIERGKYVERELVTKVFRELAAIDKKELMNIAIRSANTILALLGADSTHLPSIVAEIKGEVWKVLEQKKELLKIFVEEEDAN